MNKQQKIVLVVAILASLVAFLDGAIVNVALPAIQKQFGGGLASQQWIIDAYLLTLGSCILIAGSLSDLFGRKRVLVVGLIGFGVSSVLCALAPSNTFLIIFRAIQGLAGALLVPSSLALISSNISGKHFSRAIGLWTAWTGVAMVIGPLVGGLFTDYASWRWSFGINVVPILVTLIMLRLLPKEESHAPKPSVDVVGAVLCALGLAGVVYACIEQPRLGWGTSVLASLAAGVFLLALFLYQEWRAKHPMLPLMLFWKRNFSVGNAATFFVYAGLSAATFIIALFLQQVAGYSATAGGLSLLPVTILMFALSPLVGRISARFGPRWFMALGPVVAGVGLLYVGIALRSDAHYITQVLPGVLIFGVGLVTTVTPLTAAILGGVEHARAGIASAVNNAVARIAGLLAIAIIGAFVATQFAAFVERESVDAKVSISAHEYLEQAKAKTFVIAATSLDGADVPVARTVLVHASEHAFRSGMYAVVALLVFGGLLSAVGIQNTIKQT